MANDQAARIRWGAIGSVVLVGLAITLLPFWLSNYDDEFGAWKPLISSALTNVGTAVLLVAVVFLVERGLIRHVGKVAEQRATAVVDERTHKLAEANRDLSVRLEALQAKLEERGTQEDSERTAKVGRLSTEVSFDHVADALRAADDLGALASGTITVPAGSFDAPRITVWFGPEPFTSVTDTGQLKPRSSLLSLRLRVPRQSQFGTPIVQVEWRSDESPTEMLLKFRHVMRRLGYGTEAKNLDPDALFSNLHAAIAAAIAARTDPDEAWAHGPMYEWVADGLAITTSGVVSSKFGRVEACPESVEPELWAKAVELNRRHNDRRNDANWFGRSGSGVTGFGESSPIHPERSS